MCVVRETKARVCSTRLRDGHLHKTLKSTQKVSLALHRRQTFYVIITAHTLSSRDTRMRTLGASHTSCGIFTRNTCCVILSIHPVSLTGQPNQVPQCLHATLNAVLVINPYLYAPPASCGNRDSKPGALRGMWITVNNREANMKTFPLKKRVREVRKQCIYSRTPRRRDVVGFHGVCRSHAKVMDKIK